MTEMKHVVIVDDDHFVLRTTSFQVKGIGCHQVQTFDNARDALALLAHSDHGVEAVILDLNMPDITGIDMIRCLADQQFPGHIILFSGEDLYTLEAVEKLAQARGLSVAARISKPVDSQQLRQVLLNIKQPAEAILSKPAITRTISKQRLQQAILHNELTPWLQPKIHLINQEVFGVEVLARWSAPDLGNIFPDEFIPLLERYDLIDEMTLSLTRQVIAFFREHHHSLEQIHIAINLSMKSLQQSSFFIALENVLAHYNESPGRFTFEVTESCLNRDMAEVLDVLSSLRLKRISLSIDDFGTGYSNLTQLKDLPFDELKLDKSFVSSVWDNSKSQIILHNSINLAKQLNMTVVAEGIETSQEMELVKQMGVDYAQGYYFARPMPMDRFPVWLEEWSELRYQLFSFVPVQPAFPPETPKRESYRLQVLRSLNILDTHKEEAFDRITRIAQRAFDVPVVLVSLVDSDRQWFKSKVGLDATQTSREISFCGHAIMSEETFLVEDALNDHRFSSNPLVTGEPGIRFYAGQPLSVRGGNVGTLCCIDFKPRAFTEQDKQLMADLAELVVQEMELRLQALSAADQY
ncbi:EAL domain-containing protein [Oceanospirillum sediminis]|uniref:EAL domain-containing protein n=1 Tax=Oceanospirillum sediminis TaxID=2760088 RepID=A0A839IJ52_9GAMM|nr:EAL domain-containing protein [Oceanospirillum sediminis]MBB1485373.1 EAL domain-containing protein [Oceanospirillum sediminis]